MMPQRAASQNPGDTPASPYVLWQKHDAAPLNTPGHLLQWNNDVPPTYSADEDFYPPAPNQMPTTYGAGLDWWEGAVPVKDVHGNVVAYFTAGWAISKNWIPDNGCVPSTYNTTFGVPDPVRAELFDRRIGGNGTRGAMALYDLEGNIIWHKLNSISFYTDAIQDSNGDLLVTGWSASMGALNGDDGPLNLWNPTTGNPTPTVDQYECNLPRPTSQFNVLKISQNGQILWSHLYSNVDVGAPDFVQNGLGLTGGANGIIETRIDNEIGYRAVGFKQVAGGAVLPYRVDLDGNGMLVDEEVYPEFSIPGYTGAHLGRFNSIARVPLEFGQEIYAVTGTRTLNGGAQGAFVWAMDETSTPLFFKHTSEDGLNGLNPALQDNSHNVAFAMDNGQPSVIWPVIADVTTNGTAPGNLFIGNHQATGLIFRYLLDGTNPSGWAAPASVGTIRAYDLQLDAVQTADGNIAVASTKWSPNLSMPNSVANFNQFPPDLQEYLECDYIGDPLCACDVPNDPDCQEVGLGYLLDGQNSVPWSLIHLFADHPDYYGYGYWFTDSYATKLRLGDGSVVWQTQWDTYDPNTDHNFPGNFRQRQCNFEIVNAHDGGLIVVGNTGHNFDDAYIAKLGPCDLLADYNGPVLDLNNQYILSVDETWTADIRVKGSIVVPNGRTLTIDGATIEFADTRNVGITTNIEVRQGGRLIIENGAHLTSLQECPESMWDGIVAPRNPNLSNNLTPEIRILDSRISNALVAVWLGSGDPLDPLASSSATGPRGYVIAERSQFENNRISLLSNSYTTFANPGLFSDITACGFTQNAPLNYPNERLQYHAYIIRNRTTRFYGCSFSNELAWDEYVNNPEWWGTGIWGIDARVTVEDMPDGTQSQFRGMGLAVRAQPSTSGLVKVDHALFVDNARGILLSSVPNARITRNLFLVPDHDVSVFGGLLATYGTFLNGATGFELEENIYLGSNATDHPKVGAAFKGTGPNNNTYYNNRFDRFRDVSVSSAGTIIQANNGNSSPNSGLHFKCNDYGNTHINDYDIAFTGPGVTIGPIQGANGPLQTDPAGNTFTPNSNASLERHLYVQLGQLNTFTYWHHDQGTTTSQVRPESFTSPPILAGWMQPTPYQYVKADACPVDLSGMILQDSEAQASAALQEKNNLEEVYGDWTDGGDTEGLKDYVLDPANDSYAVRNKLMLVAPKVSKEVWSNVFHDRQPTLNQWHLAQALLANSPLEREVQEMLDQSGMSAYYIQLVKGYQEGGISMHDLYKSDIAHFHGRMSSALYDMLAIALEEGTADAYDDALDALDALPHESRAANQVALLVAKEEYTAARVLAAAELNEDPGNGYWTVMEMLLGYLEAEQDPADADATTVANLESIAGTDEAGAAMAEAWLTVLGQDWPEGLILPGGPKSVRLPQQESFREMESPWLQAHPNPSNGPVWLAYTVPEGVTTVDLSILDGAGRQVWNRKLSSSGGIVELGAKELASGLHVASLAFDGISVGSVKLSKLR